MGIVRPGLKLMTAPAVPRKDNLPAVPQISALLNEAPERPGLPMPDTDTPTTEQLRLTDAKRLALENPMAVANIVKGWVNGEAPT